MADAPIRLAVIIGSVRSGRIGPTVADWFLQHLKPDTRFDVDVIDLADLDLPAELDGGGDTAGFALRIAAAEAFVVVTPEYNHGYPGPLKNAIDTVEEEWRAKPVGLVSYGGMSAGLRAVEQLRLVFAELHVVTMQETVSVRNAFDRIDKTGAIHPSEGAEKAAGQLLAQLHWWAMALRSARVGRPYPAAG